MYPVDTIFSDYKICRFIEDPGHRSYLTIIDGGQKLVTAQRQLRPVVAVHTFPGVVQMLEVMWRHFRRQTTEQVSLKCPSSLEKTCEVFGVSLGNRLTLCDAAAEATLEAAPSLYELHIRTHVGLASVAADWTSLAVINHVWRSLERHSVNTEKTFIRTFNWKMGFIP